jgi:hypothetical protein
MIATTGEEVFFEFDDLLINRKYGRALRRETKKKL